MTIEQGTLYHMPRIPEYTGPILPMLDTQEIIRNMPEGQWIFPRDPYDAVDRIREDELDFMKEYKREKFNEYCNGVFAEWVIWIDIAERGFQRINDLVEKGIISGDLQGINAYKSFYESFFRIEDHKEIVENPKEFLDSCRNSFLSLLSDKQLEKIKKPRPEKIIEDDISNAKTLITVFSKKYLGRSFI